MTKILLVRHGHVEGIQPERFRGRHEVPLSPLGLLQARAVARYLTGHWQPSALYSSPLQRCVQTSHEIASLCGLGVETLWELSDIDYGEWQWRTHEEVRARWPAELALWHEAPHRVRFPRGESLQDLAARTAGLLRLVTARHPGRSVVITGHDSVNRVLLLQLLDLPLSAYWSLVQDPCGLSEVDVSPQAARVLRVNETQHTRAAAATMSDKPTTAGTGRPA